LGPELSIPDAIFMQHFVHGLGIEFAEYLDMTSGGVFVHCTVEERRSILDRILSVTMLEDPQIKAPLISEDEPIISYPDTSDTSVSQAKEEFFQLTAPGIGSKMKLKTPLHFPCQSKKIASTTTLGTCQTLQPVLKGSQIRAYWTRPHGIHGFQGEPPRTVLYNQQKLVNNY
jgi:hypothetical protein